VRRRALLGGALAAPLAWRRKRHHVTQPWSNQAVSLVVIQASPGAFTGLFVYSPTPAAGNLIASIAAGAGTDPYGNTYPAGISSQSSGIEAILIGHELAWDAPADHPSNLPAMFAAPSAAIGNSLSITTGTGGAGVTAGALTLYDSHASSTVPAIPSGSPGIFVAFGCPLVSDTWHTMPAMSNGWSVGGVAKYRMTAQGDLQVSFQDLVAGSDADGTTIWAAGTFASVYRPPVNHRVVCYADVLRQPSAGIFSAAALEFRTDGSVQCFGIAAAATRADLYATIPISA
jgi:hypothetical protein